MRWPRFGTLLWALTVLLGSLLLAAAIASFVGLRSDVETYSGDVEDLAVAYDTIRQNAPDEDLPTAEEITDGTAPAPGPAGLPGRDGRDGRDATDDQVFASVNRWFVLNPLIDQPDPDDPEAQEAEIQDAETQDPESQDDEIQDDEVDDPEVQDPEIDDPDPNGTACPPGYSLQPDVIRGDEVLLCTKDPAP